MSSQVPKEFRAYFLQHSRRVMGVAALTLGLSLLLWAGIYFLFYWAALFLITLIQGVDAAEPSGFAFRFLVIAGGLCGWSFLRQALWPYPHIGDRKSAIAIALGAIFALPNMSVSAVKTLTAYRSLDEEDLFAAWRLLGKIARAGSITIQELPIEIPREATRRKVMMALQLTGLIQLQGGANRIRIANEAGKRLGQEYVRIRVKK